MNNFTPAPKQRGAVLIVALIMLLLLTIIGLSSMRDTSLQENMAGNMRDSNLALQASEAALRQGEEEVVSRFMAGTLSEFQPKVEDAPVVSYNDFHKDSPAPGEEPTYKVVLLANIRTSTEAGAPIEDEGALVRIESDGYGINTHTKNNIEKPSSHVQLRSTFLVEQ